MRTGCVRLMLLVIVGFFLKHIPAGAMSLDGEMGSSAKWGSGWVDLAEVTSFRKGDKLKLKVGGSATQVIIRLLQKGVDPNTAAGILGGPVQVPQDRVAEISVDGDYPDVVQISVHGKSSPWNLYDLGEGNGPATLLSVEVSRQGAQSEMKPPETVTFTRLQGEIGSSSKWGSGWMDLAEVRTFQKGERLRLRVGGTATNIVVRLLQKGTDPNTPAGIVGGPVQMPQDRVVEIRLDADFPEVVQVSVHGKCCPWDIYSLGAENGPAILLGCEHGKTAD